MLEERARPFEAELNLEEEIVMGGGTLLRVGEDIVLGFW